MSRTHCHGYSFDKYYPNRKDWRKPYYGCKAFDTSCRSHGSCPYCRNSIKRKRWREIADWNLEEQLNDLNQHKNKTR